MAFLTPVHAILRPIVIAALACALMLVRQASAQVATAPELKAAFLFNFVRFTTWPPAVPANAAIDMCVLGDERVASALDGLTARQEIAGRPLTVIRLRHPGAAGDCDLVYASNLDEQGERRLLDITARLPVLTTSDSSTFMRRGGIAAFHIADGRMKFSVNPSAADRAQLRISSKLLSLAVIVKDPDDVR